MTKGKEPRVDEPLPPLPLEVLLALDRMWSTWEPQRPELLVRLPYPGKRGAVHAR
jgi:hypothetical protein